LTYPSGINVGRDAKYHYLGKILTSEISHSMILQGMQVKDIGR